MSREPVQVEHVHVYLDLHASEHPNASHVDAFLSVKYERGCNCPAGEEGPSLMGLEDMAMFRAIPTATIFYPSDGVSTEKAVEMAACTKVCKAGVHYSCSLFRVLSLLCFFISAKGVCYIRTSCQDSAIVYNSNEDFHVGQAKVS